MILSYASEVAELIFEANWGMTAATANYGQLEDCFLDMRMLDAVAAEGDLHKMFAGRLKAVGPNQGANAFVIGQHPDSSFPYEIRFVWNGAHAEKVDVSLSVVE